MKEELSWAVFTHPESCWYWEQARGNMWWELCFDNLGFYIQAKDQRGVMRVPKNWEPIHAGTVKERLW